MGLQRATSKNFAKTKHGSRTSRGMERRGSEVRSPRVEFVGDTVVRAAREDEIFNDGLHDVLAQDEFASGFDIL